MALLNNPMQRNLEPTFKEAWYSGLVKEVESSISNATLSRYKNKRVLTLFDNTTFIEFIRKSQLYTEKDPTDQYYFVEAGKRVRPDLISNDLYGTPIFYWVILSDNNMVSPLQAKTNLTLRVPSLANIVNNKKLI